jgi:hypothetical protein
MQSVARRRGIAENQFAGFPGAALFTSADSVVTIKVVIPSEAGDLQFVRNLDGRD